ncbi:Beta-galactosidase protein [Dioscorea alata]|nr:Beta-galactosidase protein [Dioscorea alata]
MTLKGINSLDLSTKEWTYQIGLKGEQSRQFEDFGASQWVSLSTIPTNQPLIWYKTTFNAPVGNNPIAMNFTGIGKGEAWVNGQSIGRYWPKNIAPQSGCSSCNYGGTFKNYKCLKNHEKPSQQLYHVPCSFIKLKSNSLVLFEEMGGDPTQISLATKEIASVCAHVSELHPSPVDA